MAHPSVRGNFLWYDLSTTDLAAAKTFYTHVAGWTLQPFEGAGEKPYEMWVANGQPIGGLMDLPEQAKAMGAPPHWLLYVGTPDVEATVAQAKRLGAQVYFPPTDIPGVGRFAILADPQGAAFAVFQPGGDEPMGTGEAMSWHELYTTDEKAAFGFYSELFGWRTHQEMDMGPMGIYRIYGVADRPLGGMMTKPPTHAAPPAWLAYIHVADLDGAVARAQAGGAKLLNGPMEVPGGDRIAQLTDPQGAAFALHETKR